MSVRRTVHDRFRPKRPKVRGSAAQCDRKTALPPILLLLLTLLPLAIAPALQPLAAAAVAGGAGGAGGAGDEDHAAQTIEVRAESAAENAAEDAPSGAPPKQNTPAPPDRVVIRMSRTQEVGGLVEFEDEETIVIRTPEGRLESFAKARVFQLMRLITPAPGQTGTVVRRDGTRQQGIILEDELTHVRLEVTGVRVTVPRSEVHALLFDAPFEERYDRLRRSMDRSTPDQQHQLAQWLRAERHYNLAARELRELLTRFDHEPSRRLLALVDLELELEAERNERELRGARESEAARPSLRERDEQRILTDEEVNLLRVYELDFNNPPRVVVPRPTIQKLISSYAADPLMPPTEMERNRLFREDPLNIVRLIFELRARELYPEIRVITEPYAFNLFRQRVHDAWLIPNCATSRCHGGDDAGRLALIGRGSRDVRVRYTNYLIINRLILDDPDWPLINYQRPLDSLLIQHALPRSISRKPHPDVPGYAPAIQRADDERLKDFALFISALHPRRIDYPIEFVPEPTPGWLARMATREAETDLADPETDQPKTPEGGRIDR